MKGKTTDLFFVIAIFAGFGFRSVFQYIFSSVLPGFPFYIFMVAGFGFCAWFWSVLQKEIKIRDEERDAVLKHERRKQSLILKNHPLYESSRDEHGIQSMDQLGYYFNSHEEDVAGMDYDSDGRYIFKDHKYFR